MNLLVYKKDIHLAKEMKLFWYEENKSTKGKRRAR